MMPKHAVMRSLLLYPTNACNLRCVYCHATSGPNAGPRLGRDHACAALDRFFHSLDPQVRAVVLRFHGGGEPTTNFPVMAAALAHFSQHAAKRDLAASAQTITNGVFGKTAASCLPVPPVLPVLGFASDVEVLPQGLRRGTTITPPPDLMVVVALASGMLMDEANRPSHAFSAALDLLHRQCLLAWRVDDLAVATPLIAGIGLLQFQLTPPMPPTTPTSTTSSRAVPLSRFALLRRSAGEWLLESGRSRWVVRLTDAGVSGLADLSGLGSRSAPFLALLGATGMLDDRDSEPAARFWEPHDRYFASRSRIDFSMASCWRAELRQTQLEPEPGMRVGPDGAQRIALPVPVGPQLDEPSLWTATETRRTVRLFADQPVSLAALGTLLWRTLRVTRHLPRDPANPRSYEQIYRPVASGGAMSGSDLWLMCMSVCGVPQGVWRYDPFAHELVAVALQPADVERVLIRMGATPNPPPVIGLITVRHARAAWKYSGITYALELKDIGVILHALQLVAGAVGLGMCMWGSGLTEIITDLLGLDPEADAPVGEFVLGVAKPDPHE